MRAQRVSATRHRLKAGVIIFKEPVQHSILCKIKVQSKQFLLKTLSRNAHARITHYSPSSHDCDSDHYANQLTPF